MSLRKVLALTLVLCMVLSFFPVSAFADDFVIEDQPEETEEYITTIEEQPEEPEQKEEALVEETEQPEQEEELVEVIVDETKEPEESAGNTDEPQTPEQPAELQTPTLAADNTPFLGLSLQAEEIHMLSEAPGTVQVDTQEELNDAVAGAETGTVVEITVAGTYTLPNVPKNITIKGAVADAGVVFNHTDAGSIASIPNGATFENVTFNFGNVNYHGFQHAGAITMNNCKLNGRLTSYGYMEFTNCTFNAPGTAESNISDADYSMWVYGGLNVVVSYTDCTFNGIGKFLHLYNEDGVNNVLTVNVNGCTFHNTGSSNKAALNVKATCGSTPLNYTVNIDNTSTTQGDFPTASTSDKLVVLSNLVQVDEIKPAVASEIKVTLGNEQVYPAVPAAEVTVDTKGDVIATIPTGVFESGETEGVTIAPATTTGSEISVTFDATAAARIADNAGDSSVILKVENKTEAGAAANTKTFQITMVKNAGTEQEEEVFSSANAVGSATVTVPFIVPPGVYPHVYLVTDGVRTSVPVLDYDNTTVTFVAKHFSDYEVTITDWNAAEITISTAAELLAFANQVNDGEKNFSGQIIKLDRDIDLNDVIGPTEYWKPIGYGYYKSSESPDPQGPYFAGTFDGAGHTISNLRVSTTDSKKSAGLFGIVKGGTIKNLTVDNATVSNYDRFAGAIVGGALQNSVIESCHVTGEVHIIGKHFVGGLAGLSYGTIQDCSVNAYGSISADDNNGTGSDGDDVGGLVGYSSGTITNGDVSVSGTGASAYLEISGIRQVGGLVGMLDKGSVDSTSSVSGVRVKSVAAGDYIEDNGKQVPTNTIGLTVGGSSGSAFAEATATDCTLYIATVGQLEAFRDAVNAGNDFAGQTVVLLNSINLNNAAWEPIGLNTPNSLPKKNTSSNIFKGTFDGQNHTISNLYINDSDLVGAGLFGIIQDGEIKDLTLNNVSITAKSFIGSVAGFSYSVINNCDVTGTIQISGNYMQGGIVGQSYANISDCNVDGTSKDTSYVRSTYLEGDLEADKIGGIVGHWSDGSVHTISNCSVSNIKIAGTRQVGGMVGYFPAYCTMSGCSVSNVVITANTPLDYANSKSSKIEFGGVIGAFSGVGDDRGSVGVAVQNVDLLVEVEGVKSIAKMGIVSGGVYGNSFDTVPTRITDGGITVSGTNTSQATQSCDNVFIQAPGVPTPQATVTVDSTGDVTANIDNGYFSDAASADAQGNVTIAPAASANSAVSVTFNQAAAQALSSAGALTLKVEKDASKSDDTTVVVYNVRLTNASGEVFTSATGVAAATVRLPVPNGFTGTVYVHHSGDVIEREVQGEAGAKYVEVTVAHFSEFTVTQQPESVVSFYDSNNVLKYGDDLAAALAAAKSGTTVTLLKDVTLSDSVDVSKAVVLDLNGHSITPAANSTTGAGKFTANSDHDYLIGVKRGASLTVQDSSSPSAGSINSADLYVAIKETLKGEAETGTAATVTVNGGAITGHYYAICGNGSRHGTVTTVNGGTLTGTYGTAIYHPQEGTLTITNGTFHGVDAAIEIRAGNLSISGGSFTATATPTTILPNGSGTTSSGAAIAVAQHNTKKPIEVSITGGTFNGYSAFYESNPQNNPDEDIAKIELSISGGTFNATNGGTAAVYSQDAAAGKIDGFISGGSFSSVVPAAYCAAGFSPVTEANADGKYTVEETKVARIGDTQYTSLEAAFADAQDGETITLQANCSGNGIVVPQGKYTTGLTVDFAGHTYTVVGPGLAGSTGTKTQAFQLLKDNKITFQNGAIVGNNANVKMLIQNYSNLTLNSMTLDATQGTNSVNYVLSTNNGSTTINDTTITAKTGGIAFDVDSGWGNYASNEVEVTGTSKINGNVEVAFEGKTAGTPSVLKLTGGEITGNIIIGTGFEKTTVTKAETFDIAAPTGYMWSEADEHDVQHIVQVVAKIGDTPYATLEAAFAAAVDGDTITLLADCSGNGIIAPQGKFGTNGLTVNFAGHTYDISGTPVGSTGTETIGFQLLKDNKITFQSGTITADCTVNPREGRYLQRLIQNYSNLTLDGMALTMIGQYYDQTTMANCNGAIAINNSTVNAPDFTWAGISDPATVRGAAFSVGTFGSYPSVSVNVTGNSVINGNVSVDPEGDGASSTSLNLSGGELNGNIVMKDAADQATVTKADSFTASAPDGYKWVADSENKQKLVEIEYVAQTGENKYETFAEAWGVANAASGSTMQLLADVELTEQYVATGNFTLDLNGHNIDTTHRLRLVTGTLNITNTGASGENAGNITTSTPGMAPVDIRFSDAADKTAKRSLTIGQNVTLNGPCYGLNVFGTNNGTTANTIDVTVNGTVNGMLFVLGNLSNTGNNINITVNGTVDASNATGEEAVHTGIALNGIANVTVNEGAVVKGESGIEVRAGSLTVTGGTITGTADAISYTANGSGTTTKGAAIAVAQHKFANDVVPALNVTLEGGTLAGKEMIKVTDAQNKDLAGAAVVAKQSFTANSEIPAGFKWAETGTAGIYELVEATKVAQIGDKSYATLAEAVAAANAAGEPVTIQMLENVELSAGVDISGTVTLDLNGKTISDAEGVTTDYLVAVLHGGTLTVNDSANGGKISMSEQYCAIKMTKAGGDTSKTATLIVNNGTIEGYNYGISGNGNADRVNTSVTINGGTIRATAPEGVKDVAAIYQPQDGVMTLNGGTITGLTGVELRSGSLGIPTDSTVSITGTGDPASSTGNGNGTTSHGMGIAIAQHTTKKAIDVDIAGGNVYGANALAVVNPQGNTVTNVTVAVSGGTFIGTEKALNVTDTRVTQFISGGFFSEKIEDAYCKDGFTSTITVDENGLYTVVENGKATYSASLTLNDNIDVNFYVKGITDAEKGDYVVKYTFEGVEGQKNLAEVVRDDYGRYRVIVADVSSYQMGKTILITVNYKGADIESFTYSVSTYFHNIIKRYGSDASQADFVGLCYKGLDYGAAAQLYFDGKIYDGGTYDADIENLVNADTNPSNIVNANQPTGYSASAVGSITGVSGYSPSLILGSETSIKVYFKCSDPSVLTFSAKRQDKDGARVVTAVQPEEGGRYSVRITGIKSYELNKNFELTISNGSESIVLTYSPYTYAQRQWNSADTKLANLCHAFVAYGDAASTWYPNG